MPNLKGYYTFNELCILTGASAPWVKKVQRIFKLCRGEGGKGSRTYYSKKQVEVYSLIKKLRVVGLEFSEIEHFLKTRSYNQKQYVRFKAERTKKIAEEVIEICRRKK